ncbi:biliverdin-producing heme oxygenase [Consotaella aegiceratis]|uniref:biliverdin-producing heme oxygenase n=1 Tax=Consotaella aegiceratis TaxID=3097961 RepID=UPI002F3E2F99
MRKSDFPIDSTDSVRALRGALRTETRTLHDRLDQTFEGIEKLPSRADYVDFLRLNQACYSQIDPILAASTLQKAAPDLITPARAQALGDDLSQLDEPAFEAAPFELATPDLPQALGIAYVAEGSRLGARYIRVSMEKHAALQRHPDIPTRFLDEAASRDGRWDMVAALLQDNDFTSADEQRCIAAARQTFAYFLMTLDALRSRHHYPSEAS